jgi:tRNA1Val (adenine37-N6)-methyltransferase
MPMPSKPFIFKEFNVNQDKCAMKIGTDAVLLGAWTSVNNSPFSILDIGAGTGVLSLMLAQ